MNTKTNYNSEPEGHNRNNTVLTLSETQYRSILASIRRLIYKHDLHDWEKYVIQETFTVICGKQASGEPIGNLENFAFGVARNRIKIIFANLKKERALFSSNTEEKELAFEQAIATQALEVKEKEKEHAIKSERLTYLMNNCLNVLERKVIYLYYYEGKRFKDIAIEIGKSYDATRKISSRAIEKMHKNF